MRLMWMEMSSISDHLVMDQSPATSEAWKQKNRLLEVLLETLNRMIKFIEVWDQMAQTYHVFVAWW